MNKRTTYSDYVNFINKINIREDVDKWVLDNFKFITNCGNSFYIIEEEINGDIEHNRVKTLHSSLNESIKIAITDENTNKKFKIVKLKDIIKENIEEITYKKMDFVPESPLKDKKNLKDIYNIYKGSPVKYKKDTNIDNKLIEPILDHIKEVLSDNDEKNFNYILSMLAHYVQRPHIKTNICMVFISDEEGAGKNIFFDNFNSKLIGNNYSTNIDNLDTLFARFNGILANKIVTILDEVKTKFGGKSSDQFKSMITQKHLNLEEKGMEHIKINDYNNYIILTNNEVPVNIDISDRRFACFNVNNKYVGNYNYFDKLQDTFDNEKAIEHFYHYLLNYNISYFKPARDIPVTERKIDIKYDSLKSPIKYMVAVAADKIDYGIDNKNIDSNTLYNTYVDFVATYCDRSTPYRKLDFFKQIKKLISIPVINYKDKKKNKIYNINKKMVKEALIKYFKTDIENICDIMTEEFSFTDSDITDDEETNNKTNTENTHSFTNITKNDNELIFDEIEIKKLDNQPGLYMCKIDGKIKYGSHSDLKKIVDNYNSKKINVLLNM